MKYDDLAKLASLPKVEELESAFGFEAKESKNLGKEILRKIADFIDETGAELQDFIRSDGNLQSLHEAMFLTEQDRQACFTIFRECMGLRRSISAELLNTSLRDQAELIAECFESYQRHKPTLEDIFRKLSSQWKDYKKEELQLQYFG